MDHFLGTQAEQQHLPDRPTHRDILLTEETLKVLIMNLLLARERAFTLHLQIDLPDILAPLALSHRLKRTKAEFLARMTGSGSTIWEQFLICR